MTIKAYGAPNYQRFAETFMALIAARDGYEIVPGSVKVELKEKGGENDEAEIVKLRNSAACLSDGLAWKRTAMAKTGRDAQRKCSAENSKGREESATICNGIA